MMLSMDNECDGYNCTETMQVHDAREKFHDEDPSFDRNSADDRLATVYGGGDVACSNFGGTVDDMFNNNSQKKVWLSVSSDSSPEVHANGSTV